MARVITLLTDFGTVDGYVAEMKGVLASLATEATVVDISHDVPPHDVEHARLVLGRYWHRYPIGTVHLVVVDPGVGSARAAIAVESEKRLLVGPDNGVLSAALAQPGAVAVKLTVPPGASATFHGRDVFAPAAAALAIGTPLEQLGQPWPAACVIRTPDPRPGPAGSLEGHVITIDRFGNAVTNLTGALEGGTLEAAGRTFDIRHTYADVRPGEGLALTGSSGQLEIAVRDGNAASTYQLARGTPVRLVPRP